MDTLTKWKLGETLSPDEANTILEELYSGSKKHLNYSANKPINLILYSIFNNFKECKGGRRTLSFSDTEINRPFVSTSEISGYTYKIPTNEYTIYIHE